MKRIKAIVFDLDDTLVKTTSARYGAFKEIAEHYNITLTDKAIQDAWYLPLGGFMKALYHDVDTYENLMALYEMVKDKYPNKPENKAVETINELLKYVKLGIVSSASKEWIRHDLSSLEFPINKFSFIQGAEDSVFHKPHPDVFLPILEHLAKEGIDKSEIVYVGDSLVDYQAAKSAHLEFFGLADRTTSKETFTKAGASTIQNLSDLLLLVK